MRQLALSLVFMAACGAASAEIDANSLRTAGDWRLSEIGGRVACTLKLTTETALTGYEVKAPLACRRAFPPLKDVAAWALDDKGDIVLSDAKAAPIVTFPAQGASPFEVKAPDGRTWRLEQVKTPAAAAATPAPAPGA
jgi:hypothetical protein